MQTHTYTNTRRCLRPPHPTTPPHQFSAPAYLQYLVNFLLEVHVEQFVCLIQHQVLQRLQAEPLGVGQVVDDTTRGAHDHMRPLG